LPDVLDDHAAHRPLEDCRSPAIDPQGRYNVQLAVPAGHVAAARPLQIGAWAAVGWNLSMERNQRWLMEPTP
jgi:hypothetical protein